MKIAILGFGREGKSVFKFLKNSPRFKGAAIEILDKKSNRNYLKHLERFDIIFRSPGVPYNLPELKRARARGVEFLSATKLFFDYRPCRIIGVTGTKGKGTTSTLLYKILRAGGKDAYLAGNIGKSPLEILPRLRKNSLVVLELSSFQLHDMEKSPEIAVVLDVFPDHQDAHRSLKEYYDAKTNIARHQRRGDLIFFFKNHPLSRWIASKSRGRKIAVDEKKFALFNADGLMIKGAHNFKNAVMASMVAQKLGIPRKIISKTAKNFHGMEHRLELVRTMNGVRFYNDSASTNPHTSAAAVMAFLNEPHILIAGGQDKNLGYAPLVRALRHTTTAHVILFGENKTKIKRAIQKTHIPIKIVRNLKEAVLTAYRAARKLSSTTYHLLPNIIFSPGAASFDMFKNYADRGGQFKKIVKTLKSR